jgi:hypothetical protein
MRGFDRSGNQSGGHAADQHAGRTYGPAEHADFRQRYRQHSPDLHPVLHGQLNDHAGLLERRERRATSAALVPSSVA